MRYLLPLALLLGACAGGAMPAAADLQEPDTQATIDAAVAATIAAIPTPAPTATPLVLSPPQVPTPLPTGDDLLGTPFDTKFEAETTAGPGYYAVQKSNGYWYVVPGEAAFSATEARLIADEWASPEIEYWYERIYAVLSTPRTIPEAQAIRDGVLIASQHGDSYLDLMGAIEAHYEEIIGHPLP